MAWTQAPNLPTGYGYDENGNVISQNGQGLNSPSEQQMFQMGLQNQINQQQQPTTSISNTPWGTFNQAMSDYQAAGGKINTASLANGLNTVSTDPVPPPVKGLKAAAPTTGSNSGTPSPPPPAPVSQNPGSIGQPTFGTITPPFPASSGAPGGSNPNPNPAVTGLQNTDPTAIPPPPKPQGTGGGMTAGPRS